MNIRFYYNPETDLPYIYEHNVFEDEVIGILKSPGEDEACANGTRQALSQTAAGRYLRIIYVPDEIGDGIFVITAYQLSPMQLKAFRRRMKKRRK